MTKASKKTKKRVKTIALSGYYDPLHIGHIDEFKKARKYGKVIVIVNNRKQAILKKGYEFLPFKERMEIIRSIKYVDKVVPSIDKDRYVCKTLAKLRPDFYGKGGDRNKKNVTEEKKVCEKLGIKMVFGLGKKIQSSSWLINNLKRSLWKEKG
jgi:cytidyltransferase-like protein